MPPYTPDSEDGRGRRQGTTALIFVGLAIVVNALPGETQQRMASVLRSTALRPFVMTQEALASPRVRATESSRLRERLDSLVSVVTARTHLEEENRRLRGLLDLSRRLEHDFRAASVVRPGTAGSESMFLLDVGAEDGVTEPAPVITRHGLAGTVRDVRGRSSIGIDWTHPDFGVSATTLDGTVSGIVESHRGDFREEDRLVLEGTAYHTTLEDGTVVMTSGLGGVYPRGIPIGRVRGVAESEAGWRKSYWLEPFVTPGNVTHVLVLLGPTADLTGVWPADSLATDAERREMPPDSVGSREGADAAAGGGPDSAGGAPGGTP